MNTRGGLAGVSGLRSAPLAVSCRYCGFSIVKVISPFRTPKVTVPLKEPSALRSRGRRLSWENGRLSLAEINRSFLC